jgi:hypothetical protein
LTRTTPLLPKDTDILARNTLNVAVHRLFQPHALHA